MRKTLLSTPRKDLVAGVALLAAFALFTALVQLVDVQPIGQDNTDIGFATLNTWFHDFTCVHWATDIVGSVLLAFGLFAMYRFAVTCTGAKLSTQ